MSATLAYFFNFRKGFITNVIRKFKFRFHFFKLLLTNASMLFAKQSTFKSQFLQFSSFFPSGRTT